MTARRISGLAVLASAFALAGCLSLGTEPPPSLLNLAPEASTPAGSAQSGTRESALAVHEPLVPASIDVLRVPVQVNEIEIAYLQDAVWVEKPARLFRRLLAETVRVRTNRLVLDNDEPGLVAQDHLRGNLRSFGYDAATSSVVVRFDAVRRGDTGAIVSQRFEAVEDGVPAKPQAVGAALNRAANDVARQVADWLAQ